MGRNSLVQRRVEGKISKDKTWPPVEAEEGASLPDRSPPSQKPRLTSSGGLLFPSSNP